MNLEGGEPKAKRQSYAKQTHKGKIALQWHHYASPRRPYAGQQQIFQLTLIIDLIKNYFR